VVVYDDDNLHSDGSAPYNLQLSVQPDPDLHEANDIPAEATALAGSPLTGYLAASNDIDWFAATIGGNEIIEVDVIFDNQATLPDDLQASIRMMYTPAVLDGGKTCILDQECQALSKPCGNELDCAGIGNTCLATNLCAGAGVCLGGMCAANIITEWADERVGGVINPNRGTVALAAPTFGATTVYVAVQDYHANAYSISHSYTINLDLNSDPDPYEPSEVYTGGPPQADHNNSRHMAMASEVSVYGPGGCGGGTWTTGYVSYTYDQDWFKYEHPCPGEACMLRFHYDFDAGPVDFYAQIYRNGSSWMDNLTDTVDLVNQPATGPLYFGDPSHCYYAYNGDGTLLPDGGVGASFYYYINIRDMIYRDTNPEGGTWDWSSAQPYRFCIEEVAQGCLDPCVDYDEDPVGVDCGTP
jgi:hypothetical protein